MKPYEELLSKVWHHIPYDIFFWRFQVIAWPLPCWQQDSLLFICPGIYSQIYRRTPCPAVLICKRVKRSKRGVGLFQISPMQKERLFHLLWQPSWLLLGVTSQCGLQDKGLPLAFSLARKRIYLDTQLKAELTDLFWKVPEYSLFPHKAK